MYAKLITAALLAMLGGVANAQDGQLDPPNVLCPDGTDPAITGIGCMQPTLRNAIDEGRASTVLPQRTPRVEVPNDPLGNAVGNSDPGIGEMGSFGNSAIQLPKIR